MNDNIDSTKPTNTFYKKNPLFHSEKWIFDPSKEVKMTTEYSIFHHMHAVTVYTYTI